MKTKAERIAALRDALAVLTEVKTDWEVEDADESAPPLPDIPEGQEMTPEQEEQYLAEAFEDGIDALEELIEILEESEE